MKIGIVGPGAMGCLLAGKIAQAGNEVLLLDHLPERVEIINQQGLIIEGLQGTFQVKIPGYLESSGFIGDRIDTGLCQGL